MALRLHHDSRGINAIVCIVFNLFLRCACSSTKHAWSVTSMLVIPWFKLDCQRSSCDADLNGVVCVMTFPSGSKCVGGRCGNWMLVLLWWCVIACTNGLATNCSVYVHMQTAIYAELLCVALRLHHDIRGINAIVCFVFNLLLRCASSLTKRAWSVTSTLVIPWLELDCQRSSCDAYLNGVVCVMTFPSGSNCLGGRSCNRMLVLLWWCVIPCTNGLETNCSRYVHMQTTIYAELTCVALRLHHDIRDIIYCVLCFRFVVALRLLFDEACLIRY